MNVPQLDKEIGIEVNGTKSHGISGRLREFPEDFRVEEILTNGSKAQIEPKEAPHLGGRGRHLICVLVKRNCDTFQAVQALANKLNLGLERINIAGIKDARALTAQHVSISRILPNQVGQLKLKSLWLYPLEFSNEKIHSGLLYGNRFHITVRAINLTSSEIKKRTANVRDELVKLGGCPNFFGHQRFGTIRPLTHVVGKHMLLGEWEKAALIFLAKPSLFEHPESKQARKRLWNTHNFKEALHYFPLYLVYERQMLDHLAKQHGDFVGAFHRLPKKLCQLFIQAYQSYLFNKFLSRRVQNGLPLKEVQEEGRSLRFNDEDYLALPLVGYKQSLSEGSQGEIERNILEDESIKPENFKISRMRQISSPGGLRTALTPLMELEIEPPVQDSENQGEEMVSLNFVLKKGSYATVIMREFMKPRSAVEAGF